MLLSELISKDLIITDLAAAEKDKVIREMVALFPKAGIVEDEGAFLDAIEKREEIESTAIGEGIAIPHGRSERVKRLAVAFARSKAGVDFDALDGKPVYLVFMIGAPATARGEYLQAVAKIARLLKNKELKEHLLSAESVDDVMSLVEDFDRRSAPRVKVKTKEGRVIHR